jgi:hypothetical protein
MIEDGIYFGLDEDEYHADTALGSTDKKNLLGEPAAYWWGSPLNPMREEKEESAAMIKGTAVHAFVLDGPDVFAASYGRCEFPGNRKAGIEERKVFEEEGKISLPAKDYDRIVMAGTIIRLNPDIAEAFSGGMPEVSVFWTETIDGEAVRQKARLDYLKVRAVCDLKSHAPMDGISFEASCLRAIKTLRYRIQIQSYLNARAKLPELVAAGAVHGDHDPEWLAKVVAAQEFAFVLCFWSSKGAPLTWGSKFSPGNPTLDVAQRDIDMALRRYVELRREFGEDRAWIRATPLNEADGERIDNWWHVAAE